MSDDSELKTIGVKRLVEQVMAGLPEPLTEDVIEDVFCAIERRPEWLIEYEGLCADLTKTIVNNAVGVWVGRWLGFVGTQEVESTRTRLAGSYSKLTVPAVKPGAKRKKEAAEQAMSDYFRAHRAELLADIVDYRDELVKLLMDGRSPEEAFAEVRKAGSKPQRQPSSATIGKSSGRCVTGMPNVRRKDWQRLRNV